MKRLLNFTKPVAIFILMISFLSGYTAKAQPGYNDDISLQNFYDELSPYGQWIDDPDYGYVWVPQVDDPDFRPYATDGHWAMTDYGNMWVSDYEWGWAPFHYGRWAYTDDYGWFWIPDTEWAPAWVDWRSTNEYYGWAPLGPSVSVDVAIGGTYTCPDFWWTFIPQSYIYNASWYDYYVPFYRNRSIINVSIVIGNTYRRNNFRYICGPSAYDLRRGGISFTTYNIYNSRRPGRTAIRNNYVDVYRPNVNNRGSYRPSQTMSRNDYSARRSELVRNNDNNRNRGFDNRNNRNFSQGNNNRNNNGFGRNNQPGNNNGQSQGNNNRNFSPRNNNYDRGTSSPGRNMGQQRNTNGNGQGGNNNRTAGTNFPGRDARQPGNGNVNNNQQGGYSPRSNNFPGNNMSSQRNNPGNYNNSGQGNNRNPQRSYSPQRQMPQNSGGQGGYNRPSGQERSNPGMNNQRNSSQRESRGTNNGGNGQGNGRRGRG